MRKYLFIILAVMIVLSMAASAGASEFALYMRPPGTTLQKETLSGSSTGYAGVGAKLSTTITAGNRILGFQYSDSSAGALGLYDDSSVTNANASTLTNLIGEAYCSAGNNTTVMFPLPFTLTNGLVLLKTTATGVGIVYYE